ncbi:dGTP triphosphohydrolase [Dietzia maris]
MGGAVRDGAIRLVSTNRSQEKWRSHAQVDIDRLLYSPEFRRLAGVTQVVPPEDDFHFHDRLSHSIKVAQVAASLARMLVHQSQMGGDEAFSVVDIREWVDPDHCYAAALAHDIGHPPFGHAGENALQTLLESMKEEEFLLPDTSSEYGDFVPDGSRLAERSFEGNAQSTRVVSELSFRGDGVNRGLNLTLRTIAGIAKYPWLRGGHPAGQPKLAKKWSFYPEEGDVLDRLVEYGFVLPEKDGDGRVVRVQRWVEAEIMDWADDISYAVHDIDDFYRLGLVPLHQILNSVRAAPTAIKWHKATFEYVEYDEVREAFEYIAAKLKSFQRRSQSEGATSNCDLDGEEVLNGQFDAAFEQIRLLAQTMRRTANFSGTREAHGDLRRFSSAVITYLSSAASLEINESGRVQLRLDPVGVLVAEFFKAINSYFVIESVNLAAMQHGQEYSLYMLFDGLFYLAAEWLKKRADGEKSNRLPARLRSYLTVLAEEGAEPGSMAENADEELIAIAVLDYITSLRDAQASHLAAQLTGIRETAAVATAWLNN